MEEMSEPVTKMTLRAFVCVKVIFFAFFGILTAVFGTVLIGGCLWPLFFLSPPTYRLIVDYVIAMWQVSIVVSITIYSVEISLYRPRDQRTFFHLKSS